MKPETAEAILGGFGLLAIAAMPTVAALCDWGWEFAAWVSVGLMILGGAFYAFTHR